MTPYIKQIVELHKIHKAIENNGGGSNPEPTPEPTPVEKFIGFPLFIAKVVGFIDSNKFNWDGNSVVTNDDLIPIDGVFDYCEENKNSYTGPWYFSPVFEYDESLDHYEGYEGYLGFGYFEVSISSGNYYCNAIPANISVPLYVKGEKYLTAIHINDD